jgi:tetratricopeptide (TPR) repeat protein
MGRSEESQAEFGRAVALDPLSPIKCAALGWGHYFGRRFDAAIAQCERALELDPAMSVTHLWMGLALGQLGRAAEAVSAYEEAVRLSPGEPLAAAFLAHGLALAGREDEARRRLDELEAQRTRRYVSAYDLAVIHAGLGDVARAVEQLERGYEERTHWMALLGVDPRLDPLRAHPRFERLLTDLRFGRH